MLLVAIALVLGSFGLFFWSVKNFWTNPGKGLAALIGATVCFGAAWGMLHLMGMEGF